jgi:hypothetical protein
MTDTPRFGFGSLVYHKTSGENAGVVTGMLYRPGGLRYEVVWAGRETDLHLECELTAERPSIGRAKEEVYD